MGFTLGALLSLPIIKVSTEFFASEWGMQDELYRLGIARSTLYDDVAPSKQLMRVFSYVLICAVIGVTAATTVYFKEVRNHSRIQHYTNESQRKVLIGQAN